MRVLAVVLALGACAGAQTVPSTLAKVRAVHMLRCGIDVEEPEYSTADDHGARRAFDVDICKAVAVAVLGPQARWVVVEFPDDAGAMRALKTGKVDVIASLTADFSHAAGTGIAMSRPVLYDGVGFLVPKAAGITKADALSGKTVCFLEETAVEQSVRTWFAREHLEFVPFPFQEEGEMQAAFVTGNCAALAGDWTRLAETRGAFGSHAKEFVLLPERISNDPLAVATRGSDVAWGEIVQWTVETLMAAEELGVTQANVSTHTEAETAVLLGRTREIGSRLHLRESWAAEVIGAVGNYGEIFARDLGTELPRGENALVRDGGLMVALPLK